MLGRFEAPWFYIPPFPFPKECTKLTSGLTKKELNNIRIEKAYKGLEPYEQRVFELLDRLKVRDVLGMVNEQAWDNLGKIEPVKTLTTERINESNRWILNEDVLTEGLKLKFEYAHPKPIWKESHDEKKVSGITQEFDSTEFYATIARRGDSKRRCIDDTDGHGFYLRCGSKEDIERYSQGKGPRGSEYGYNINVKDGYLDVKEDVRLKKYLEKVILEDCEKRRESQKLPTDILKRILYKETMIKRAINKKRKFYHAEYSLRGDLFWNHS